MAGNNLALEIVSNDEKSYVAHQMEIRKSRNTEKQQLETFEHKMTAFCIYTNINNHYKVSRSSGKNEQQTQIWEHKRFYSITLAFN